MKAHGVPLWLLGVMTILCLGHSRALRRCPISMDMYHLQQSFQDIKRVMQANDTFQNITVLSTLENLQSIKPLDVCCVTGHLLAFYVDRVFKDHQEPDPHILRKISGIANSFLYMQKTVQQCQVQRQCHCREEATNATQIIHDNYNQGEREKERDLNYQFMLPMPTVATAGNSFQVFHLEARSAAIKSLGELNVFLAWLSENHQDSSAA